MTRRCLVHGVLGGIACGPLEPSRAAARTVYYVAPDGDDGRNGLSPRTAWRTACRASGQPLNPGDTVIFEDGVYHETQPFRPVSGGSVEGAIPGRGGGSLKPCRGSWCAGCHTGPVLSVEDCA